MAIEKVELEEENNYLKETLVVLKELVNSQSKNINKKIDVVTEMKKYIWENVGTLDDVEVIQEMTNIDSEVQNTNSNIKSLEKLKRSLSSPYFGRVDFIEDGILEKVYIGINGVSKDFNFYVYDWRTPIASLFYNYGVGDANYEAPVGTINGEVALKRQYKIKDGKLERCFNSDINIDDEYLQEILSNSASDKMTNIVNTIQKEQNEIIRNIIDKYLIVQGIAGSGKTSVALHRIAYLLYKEKNLTSNNVLIFSPNDVFTNYISDVLPELGEENVLQSTFSDFASSYIKNFKSIESFTEFVERYYKDNKQIEKNEEKYKQSDDFKKIIDEYLKNMIKNAHFSGGVNINNREISAEQLTNLFVDKYEKLPIINRLENIAEYICDYCNISVKAHHKSITDILNKSINIKLSAEDIYIDILNSNNFKNAIDKNDYSASLHNKKLNYEDLIPLMYINFEINGYPNGNNIKHVIIDEAQDYSILQFELLKKIFDKASFTILGDVNQTINPYYKYDTLERINDIFDNKGKYIELNKTYRSSEEIIEYTNKILNLNNTCSVRRSNHLPIVYRDVEKNDMINQLISDISLMRENGMKKISIITKNNFEALSLYKKLKLIMDDISIINDSLTNNLDFVMVLPSYISKGLEFDSVIACIDKDNLYSENERNLFYVVCTRAQHSLTVYNQKKFEKRI